MSIRSGKPLVKRKPPPLDPDGHDSIPRQKPITRASDSSVPTYTNGSEYDYKRMSLGSVSTYDTNSLAPSIYYTNDYSSISSPISTGPPPVPTRPPKDLIRRKSQAVKEFLGVDYYPQENGDQSGYQSDSFNYNSTYSDGHNTFINTSNEYESPRLMGPRELPAYLDASNSFYSPVATPTTNYPHSPFEYRPDQVLRSQAYQTYNTDYFSGTAPYPINESDFLSDGFDDPSGSPLIGHQSLSESPEKQQTPHLQRYMESPKLYNKHSTPLKRSEEVSSPIPVPNDLAQRNMTLRTPISSRNNSPTKMSRYSPPKSQWSRSPSPKKFSSSTNLRSQLEKLDFNANSSFQDSFQDDEFGDARSDFSRSPTLSSGWYSNYERNEDNAEIDFPVLPSLPPPSPGAGMMDLQPTFSLMRKKDDDLPPIPLDLPALPFSSSSLVSSHFNQCPDVWAISSVCAWCKCLPIWLHDSVIPKAEFKSALVKLMVFHRPNTPLHVVENNVNYIIQNFLENFVIGYEVLVDSLGQHENVIFFENHISGVLPDLLPCYSRHTSDLTQCYSSRCHLNKAKTFDEPVQVKDIADLTLSSDWPSHWNLTAADIGTLSEKEVRKQCQIFDLIRRESQLLEDGNRFVKVYGKSFMSQKPPIVQDYKKFHEDAFLILEPFLEVHKNYLVDPLCNILLEEGKFITSVTKIAEIYIEWTHMVKIPFLKYSGKFEIVKQLASDEKFKKWLYNVDNKDKERERYFSRTFFKPIIESPLTLREICHGFESDSEQFEGLTKAIKLIKKLGDKVEDMQSHTEKIQNLKAISQQLIWKPNLEVKLNLSSANRVLIKRGDLTKKGDLRINSSTVHLILLDNFLLITEPTRISKSQLKFKVSERPIPIEFLLIEKKDKDSSLLSPTEARQSNPLSRSQTYQSIASDAVTIDDSSYFSFKIRFAGRGKHNSYTVSTKSESERLEWLTALEEARNSLCEKLIKGDPFKLEVLADSAFAYEENEKYTKLPILAKSDPINIACIEVTEFYDSPVLPRPLFFSKVLVTSQFVIGGKEFYLCGLKYGVYASEKGKPRTWKRVLELSTVSQISVLVEMNLVVVLANKYLHYYPLDSIIGVYNGKQRKISGGKITNSEISFYKVGQHKGMTMIFYAKSRSTSSTTFKVIIPQTDNGGVFSSFHVLKKFYIQAECYGISIFNTSFAVHTIKGFEILDLDKLLPRSVPELPAAESVKKVDGYSRKPLSNGVELIRKSVNSANIKPMGMFKLQNNSEFLLVFNDFAIFTNKHGKLSRFSMLRFEFKAKKIAFDKNFLVLICEEVAEIWSISDFVNGTNKLIQVVSGKDLSLVSNEGNFALCVANPKVLGRQLILELRTKIDTQNKDI